jgi:hypothetical protein
MLIVLVAGKTNYNLHIRYEVKKRKTFLVFFSVRKKTEMRLEKYI